MRSRKAVINIITSMADQVIATICAFLIPRLILVTFGSEYFGVVQSITQYMGIVELMTIGLSGAARVALYKPLAEKKYYEISRIIKSFRMHMRKAAALLIGYILLLSLVYSYISHNSLTKIEIAEVVLIIGMRTIAESLLMGVSLSLLAADQLVSVYACTMTVARILNAAIILVLIGQGRNIVSVYFFSNLAFLVAAVFLDVFIRRYYRLTSECEPNESAFALRGAVAYHNIANYVHENVDITLLTLFSEASLISVYSIYHLITAKMHVIMRVFTNGLEGAFGNMWAKEEHDTLKHNFHLYEFCIFSFVAVVFTCVGLLIIPFINLYTAGVKDQNYIFYDIAVFSTLAEGIYCLREPYLTLTYATGKYEETKKASAYEAIINLVISISLIRVMGITGLLIGTIAANTFRTLHFIWFDYKHILKQPNVRLVRLLVLLVLNMSVSIGLGLTFIRKNPITNWLGWVCTAIVILVIAALTVVITSLIWNRNDFLSVFKKLLHVFKRKSRHLNE